MFEEIVRAAKAVVEEHGDHEEMFFVKGKNGGVSVVVVQSEANDEAAKKEKVEELRRFIEKAKSVEYYHVSSAWSVNQDDARKNSIEELRKLRSDPSPEAMKRFLEGMMRRTRSSPSEHPDRKEVLIVSKCVKGMGTRTMVIPFTRSGNSILWGESEIVGDKGHFYNRYNVWVPEQYVMDEVDGWDSI